MHLLPLFKIFNNKIKSVNKRLRTAVLSHTNCTIQLRLMLLLEIISVLITIHTFHQIRTLPTRRSRSRMKRNRKKMKTTNWWRPSRRLKRYRGTTRRISRQRTASWICVFTRCTTSWPWPPSRETCTSTTTAMTRTNWWPHTSFIPKPVGILNSAKTATLCSAVQRCGLIITLLLYSSIICQ